MKILIDAFLLFLAAFGVHLILWRFALPRRQTAVLVAIFGGAWLVFLALGFADRPLFSVYSSLLYWSAALAYLVTYSAMEGDSPTLSLIRHLDSTGDAGISQAEMDLFFEKRPFVRARLDALVNDGILVADESGYRLAGGTPFLFRIVLVYRRVVFGRTQFGA
jgi:hypothetical protein